MRISNGNFLDEDGNEVNLVELLRTGKATPVVNNNDGHHMSAHSGWFTDENGTPVNIVALIDAAIDEDGGDDEPAIGGISINGGNVVTPDENGIINLTISGDGSTVIDSELSASSTNPVQNKVVTGAIEDLNDEFINAFPTDIVSGEIASFSDGADDLPVKNLTVNIEPTQDLHGYENPWPAGGGINIWDEEWEQGRIANGVNASNAQGFRSKNKIKINPNTTYYLYVGSEDYGNFWVSYYDEDEVNIPSTNAVGYANLSKNREFTTPENAYYMRFFLSVATEYKNDISINYPSTNTDYYPYYNICPISGWTGAKVIHTGKNLFPLTISINDNTYGHSYLKTDYPSEFAELFTELKRLKGLEIIYSAKITGTASGITIGQIRFLTGSTVLFSITPNNVKIVPDENWDSVTSIVIYGSTSGATVTDCQFELGSTATDYEPYKGESYYIDWTNEAGEVFGGTLDALSGVLTVDRVIVDLGTLTWSYITTQGRNYFLAAVSNRLNNSKMVCSMYPWKGNSTDSSMGTRDNATLWGDSGGSAIKIKDSSYTDANLFKTAMNGVHLCYELAEPQIYQLSPHEVKSLLGYNAVYATTGDASVEYRADIKRYIDKIVATLIS